MNDYPTVLLPLRILWIKVEKRNLKLTVYKKQKCKWNCFLRHSGRLGKLKSTYRCYFLQNHSTYEETQIKWVHSPNLTRWLSKASWRAGGCGMCDISSNVAEQTQSKAALGILSYNLCIFKNTEEKTYHLKTGRWFNPCFRCPLQC